MLRLQFLSHRTRPLCGSPLTCLSRALEGHDLSCERKAPVNAVVVTSSKWHDRLASPRATGRWRKQCHRQHALVDVLGESITPRGSHDVEGFAGITRGKRVSDHQAERNTAVDRTRFAERIVLSEPQAAEYLGTTVRKLRRLRAAGLIRFTRVGKTPVYRLRFLDEYLDRGEVRLGRRT